MPFDREIRTGQVSPTLRTPTKPRPSLAQGFAFLRSEEPRGPRLCCPNHSRAVQSSRTVQSGTTHGAWPNETGFTLIAKGTQATSSNTKSQCTPIPAAAPVNLPWHTQYRYCKQGVCAALTHKHPTLYPSLTASSKACRGCVPPTSLGHNVPLCPQVPCPLPPTPFLPGPLASTQHASNVTPLFYTIS